MCSSPEQSGSSFRTLIRFGLQTLLFQNAILLEKTSELWDQLELHVQNYSGLDQTVE